MDYLVGTYRFRIGGQLGPITIRIWNDDRNHHSVEFSHFLKTPIQAGISAPQPSDRNWADPYMIADQVAATLNSEFQEAVDAGHKPDASWLIANERF